MCKILDARINWGFFHMEKQTNMLLAKFFICVWILTFSCVYTSGWSFLNNKNIPPKLQTKQQ